MEKVLPVYDLLIDDNPDSELEVNYTALVSLPAIEKNFIAFNDQQPIKQYSFNEEQRIAFGPMMIADLPIYRRDNEWGEYYVKFDKEQIKKVAQKYFNKSFHKNFNLSHDPNLKVEGVYTFQSFITDNTLGIMPPKGYEDVPEGSWFVATKIDNSDVWADVKSGTFKGFSVEGMFRYKKQQLSKEQELFNAIKEILSKVEL